MFFNNFLLMICVVGASGLPGQSMRKLEKIPRTGPR